MRLNQDFFISGNTKVVRNINRSVILNIIRINQPISRVRIAKISRLNKSTVSSIVVDLLRENLIYETVDQDNNVGRNPINLHLKLGKHFVGGINIDSHTTRMAIIDIDGSLKDCYDMPTQAHLEEEFISGCVGKLLDLRDRAGISHFKGIGVTIAGIVDSAHSSVVYAPNLGWENLEVAKIIREACPEAGPIIVENDAKASALAELWFGKHDTDYSNFVFLSIGPGIGAGIVVEKMLVEGETNAAGEFGHMTLFGEGAHCACGNNGCWEAYASDRATVRRYIVRKYVNPNKAPVLLLNDIIDFAKAGDQLAREVLIRTGYYLGLGIANIIMTMDPEAIILGGRILQAWDIVYPEILRTITDRAFFERKRKFNILPTSLAIRPRLLGAATLVIKEIFSDLRITT